ncbi:MobQ family relaxase [Streptococcus equi]|uniref:MobQ family relaxase n=1 Tax=Streptococcus equi TaxID=1336 RepID=UPI0005BE4E65|nr:MobQ family relaxase [Streptococcus equi]VTP88780.1 MobA/MobL family protein [Streptococcus equi subsp. zooepidemicus]KIS15422.1 ATP-dependent exoDNAse (exonuclease V) subunit alpha [Streptococcus equi subsp. zooepidemicus SzAM35]HEK9996791.1 MobA/MobL family protein [Streptococcus equi subsp. zooepidemicus]HEL0553909.1 MobA/MobL family protein [Streptococcus equi subsp. zooepidemicus]HEL0584438.1 MobA/MobL family protein [Streptococcus equi subsp. zooepidemicus]
MADSFHFNISMISRGKSKSAVASAAYISCEKLTNEWDGVTHDYHNKKGLLHSEIFLPENIPKEFQDRSFLWNSVELNERANNAQLARNFIIALPKELSVEENKKLITEFIQENFVSKGMIADLAIHEGNDEEKKNIHAHIMTTLRPINEKGQWQAKSKKEYVLDEKGEKIKLKSGNYKTRKVELTDWNDRGNAEKWRENFATLCNQYLEKNNLAKRVDHRSFKRQGKEEIPTIHLGASASALERKGIETDKGKINREIKKHNSLVKAIREKIAELTSWIGSLIGNLQSKYDEYKQTRQDEIDNKAELFNLYEYISIYNDIQGEKTKTLSYYGQIKKGNADLKRFVKAIYYLKDNNLKSIADLQGKIFELAKESKNINSDVQARTEKIKNLNQCISCASIIRENKEIYQEYKNKTILKESFYKNHKEEIDKYKMARKTIEKFTGTSAVKINEWEKGIEKLEKEIETLNEDKIKIQDEFKQIDHIKYAVKTVNDDYGIDLSIEIDKAIKRGEKPSVIAQLKKFKEQQEKTEQYQKRAKEKYTEQER